MRIKSYKVFESEAKSVVVIQIDSRKRTVNLVNVNNWNYKKISELIGHGCRLFTSVYYYDNEDTLYTDDEFLIREFDIEVDEEGMYNPADYGFVFEPYNPEYPLWGNGVIVGSDEEGESVSVKSVLDDVRRSIMFIDKSEGANKIKVWKWDGKQYKRIR